MFRMSTWVLGVVCMMVVVSSCAVSEERSGPGADGIPEVQLACASDHPDCEDTVTEGVLPTGGDDPVDPSSSPDPGTLSGGMVVEGGISIAEAIAYEGTEPVAVHGYIVRTSETAQLCETLAESFPPQCGGASLTLVNADSTVDLVLIEEGDVQWSPETVILVGTLAGAELTIESTVSG